MGYYSEEDWFPLSALHRYAYCPRRFALAHIEDQWADNVHTIEGNLVHEKVHDSEIEDVRPDKIVKRAMRVFSAELGISGECDAVEFLRSDDGIALSGHSGLWKPSPVEYKKGKPLTSLSDEDCDVLQLCCQTMCLEGMLCCDIPRGYLYYASIRRRIPVDFTDGMRSKVVSYLQEMHRLYDRKYTPRVKRGSRCKGCSLYEVCLPELFAKKSVDAYIAVNIGDKV